MSGEMCPALVAIGVDEAGRFRGSLGWEQGKQGVGNREQGGEGGGLPSALDLIHTHQYRQGSRAGKKFRKEGINNNKWDFRGHIEKKVCY